MLLAKALEGLQTREYAGQVHRETNGREPEAPAQEEASTRPVRTSGIDNWGRLDSWYIQPVVGTKMSSYVSFACRLDPEVCQNPSSALCPARALSLGTLNTLYSIGKWQTACARGTRISLLPVGGAIVPHPPTFLQ